MEISLENLGTVNQNTVKIGDVQLWFSYETCIAYKVPGYHIVVCENAWSTTTGKLLNKLEPDKDARYPREAFKKFLDKVFSKIEVKAIKFY